ncbi:hypothetical protein OG417_23565 [Actinoallomurus sp. NBC_01490]|uniref:hypothetical protein n=1 Tax=Actinoallomurus sp. NBC_01490 TaxID=2903557 RepID=UPI002E34332D|nr:hypothetical protein [Actinoallomurus sp. NBC_01490]
MRRWQWAVAVASAMGVTACSPSGAGGEPVRATPPSVAPSPSVRTVAPGHACLIRHGTEGGRDHGLVSVGSHPSGVVAVWFPGMNQRPCRAALTRGNAEVARRLAKDIRAAPKWPSGAFNCPSDDRRGARLYFQRSGSALADLVDLRLSGCRGIDAPGRSPRWMTERLFRDLSSIEPAPWRPR